MGKTKSLNSSLSTKFRSSPVFPSSPVAASLLKTDNVYFRLSRFD